MWGKLMQRIRSVFGRTTSPEGTPEARHSSMPADKPGGAGTEVLRGPRTRARSHHYLFAHRMLRDAFYGAPRQAVSVLATDGDRVLTRMWDHVGDIVAEKEGDDARLPSEGLAVTVRLVDAGTRVAIVTLPRPEVQTEAHFVGMVVGPGEAADYWTLEKANPTIGPESGVHLCSWSSRGSHALMRAQVEPTFESFLSAIAPGG